jgi:5-oxoprolinase (ATP-hydrolysing)
MAGGEPGAVGANYWMKRKRSAPSKPESKEDGRAPPPKEVKWTKISLGGCNQTRMRAGDRIVIREWRITMLTRRSESELTPDTPGGGGYGVAGTVDDRLDENAYQRSVIAPVRAAGSLASFKAAQMSAN